MLSSSTGREVAMTISATALAAIAASAALGTSLSALAEEWPEVTPVRLILPAVAPPPCASQLRDFGRDTNFAAFVDASCPADIQRRGLRQLWRMLPSKPDDNPFG
jgi:hypothetical protein